MQFPGEALYREERAEFVRTLESLTDAEFDAGRTLCEDWSPRDVLAHVMGLDTRLDAYVKGVTVKRGNALIVDAYRDMSRAEITERAHHWVDSPALLPRLASAFLLGDLCMHHQDVLRPLGRTRELDETRSAAILREGIVLGGVKLTRYRLEPTDGGRSLGRGRSVRGTREALGLWLAGRKGLEAELELG